VHAWIWLLLLLLMLDLHGPTALNALHFLAAPGIGSEHAIQSDQVQSIRPSEIEHIQVCEKKKKISDP
jgi:hypothetical protein